MLERQIKELGRVKSIRPHFEYYPLNIVGKLMIILHGKTCIDPSIYCGWNRNSHGIGFYFKSPEHRRRMLLASLNTPYPLMKRPEFKSGMKKSEVEKEIRGKISSQLNYHSFNTASGEDKAHINPGGGKDEIVLFNVHPDYHFHKNLTQFDRFKIRSSEKGKSKDPEKVKVPSGAVIKSVQVDAQLSK
ncbi:hypothetical protein RQP46_010691 [Phenoliferia psychrophenolica]